MNEESAIKIGYKEASLSVKGVSVFIALALLLVVGSMFVVGYLIQQTIIREAAATALELKAVNGHATEGHTIIIKIQEKLRVSQDRISCIMTLPQNERTIFGKNYQPGNFVRACPWIGE
jgi:uncharacterized membrane protein YjgN (DUF898 family)